MLATSDVFFSNEGHLLCSRCKSFEQAHDQVDRAITSAFSTISGGGGVLGPYRGGLFATLTALLWRNRMSVLYHAELEAINASQAGPQVDILRRELTTRKWFLALALAAAFFAFPAVLLLLARD